MLARAGQQWHMRCAVVSAEGVRLSGPIEVARALGVAMRMMLGSVMVDDDTVVVCGCGDIKIPRVFYFG